jgi:hypothetical protein
MVAIQQETTVQPGGIIHIHSDELPPGARARVTVVIETSSSNGEQITQSSDSTTPRIPGLWQGKIWMADDFESELPETFWLGGE